MKPREILFTPSSSSILRDWPSKPPVEVSWGVGGCTAPGVRPCARTWLAGGVCGGAATPGTLPPGAAARSPQLGGPGRRPLGVRPSRPPAPSPPRRILGAPHAPGTPTAAAPSLQPQGARRGPDRTPTSPCTHRARTPRPPRWQIGSQGARKRAGRPGRRRRRSPGHVPGGPGERRGERSRRRWSAGASEPRVPPPPLLPGWRVSRHRHRFASGPRRGGPAAAAAATAPATASREITIKGRDASRRKRKRRLPSRSRAAGALTKGGRPPKPPPPAPSPRRIAGPGVSARGAPGPPRAGPHPTTPGPGRG